MSDEDLDQLREELMVQEIMLDSLADANDDANGVEKKEIEKDIARLKRLIARGERGESAIEDDDNGKRPLERLPCDKAARLTTNSAVGVGSAGAPGAQSAQLDTQPPRPTPITPRHRSRGT